MSTSDEHASAALSRLVEMVQEAQAVREEVPAPSSEIDPSEFLRLAADHRRCVDRLEFLLGQSMLIRWQMQQRKAAAMAAVEDAETSLDTSFGEFTSARERDLKIKTLTIDSRRMLRTAERELTDAFEAEKFLRLVHQGADAARRDLDSRLRAMSLITQMER